MIGFLVDSFVVEGFSSMFYVELNLRYEKGLINCVQHSSTYEKVLILGDFNVST